MSNCESSINPKTTWCLTVGQTHNYFTVFTSMLSSLGGKESGLSTFYDRITECPIIWVIFNNPRSSFQKAQKAQYVMSNKHCTIEVGSGDTYSPSMVQGITLMRSRRFLVLFYINELRMFAYLLF